MALALASVVALTACASSTKGSPKTGGSSAGVAATSSATSSSATAKPATLVKVHVSINISDGATLGIGMPYIATFDKKITDGVAFAKATKVTVNGQPVTAAWYFEYSDPASGHVMEAHLRMESYWPPNSQIHVDLPVKGLSGGAVPNHLNAQYVFGDNLTSDWATGDAHILTVSNATHTLTVRDNGKVWGTFPVSLGAPNSPTKRGYKVIMEKVPTVCMHDTDNTYYECGIKLDQRLTYDGEYLHSAPWNLHNIAVGVNSSNGCTNLTPTDAKKLYDFLSVGDVVWYPDADGPRMQLGQGFGDWNLTWSLWQTGGAVKTS